MADRLTVEDVEKYIKEGEAYYYKPEADVFLNQLADTMRENDVLKSVMGLIASGAIYGDNCRAIANTTMNELSNKESAIISSEFMPQQFNDALQGKSSQNPLCDYCGHEGIFSYCPKSPDAKHKIINTNNSQQPTTSHNNKLNK